MNVLVTGGTGFIGSHTVVELIKEGHNVVIVDNLVNSEKVVVDKIKTITGVEPTFYEVDCCNYNGFEKVFKNHRFDAVIHFAGLKAVGESVVKPLEYYKNNLYSTITLLELMVKYDVTKIVFSSSATVYGTPKTVPLKETDPIGGTTNPYGTTKLDIEILLKEFSVAYPKFKIFALRYFNPIGAHESGLLGESPVGIPNNLMPYISKVAAKKLSKLSVFGNDYDTPDGTGVRDYIHVVDLALGHVAAINSFDKISHFEAVNLGTGRGTSVLELVEAYKSANTVHVPIEIQPRRSGDIATNYADVTKAKELLNFTAKRTIYDACKDSYNFEKNIK